MLDSMDGNQSAWGPATPETKLLKQGKASLRWLPDEGALNRDDLAINLAQYNSLRLWIHSPSVTFARIKIAIPITDTEDSFSLTFKVDWEGWNRMELPPWRFRGGGNNPQQAWGKTQGLILTQTEPGFEPTELVLDGVEVSTDWPQIPVNDHETLIDWPYWGARSLHLWKPTEETTSQPPNSHGFSRYWCWGYMWLIEDPTKREVCAYTRQFGADITQYDTLEVRASNDSEGYLSVHIQTDGQWSTPVEYHKGTGGFEELQIPLPTGAKRLDAVTLDISEPPDEIGGSKGRQIKCNFMWLLLRKPGSPRGTPPTKLPPIEPIPLNGALDVWDRSPSDPELVEGNRDAPEGPNTRSRRVRPKYPARSATGVYFGPDDLPAIRSLFLEGAGKDLWTGIERRADHYLTTSPEDYAGRWYPAKSWVTSRAEAPSYPVAQAARTCALAYVITGEKKYADFARRALLVMTKIDNWVEGIFARYPLGWGGHGNPFSEAALSYEIGLAYDWAYTALSDDERKAVEDSLIRQGIWWTYDKLKHSPSILKMNQGVVFDSNIGCALMALEPSRPELADMRKQTEDWLWQGIEQYSLRDGASNEGVGYWHYTWNTAVRLLAAMARRDPDGLFARCPEKVKLAMDWLVHMKSNNSEGFKGVFFCDGGGGAPSPAVSAFFAKCLKSPTGAWFQARYSRPNDELSAFMWEHDQKPETPPMILARHFRGAGYVFLREGFEYGDVLFTLLGQPPLAGHNQRDRTSFTIEAFGEHLAMDPGMIAYSDPIHTSLANTRLHNAMTIDGAEAQHNAKVIGFFSSPLLDYAAVDGKGAYPQAESYVRRAIFLRPDHFVISDDMRLKSPGRIEWNLNSAGDLSLEGSRVLAHAKSAALVVDFASPRDLNIETELWPCGYPGIENHHGTIYSKPSADAERYLVSLYPVRKDQEAEVQVEPISAPQAQGIRIKRGDQEELVVERLGEEPIRAEGIESDAAIAVIRLRAGGLVGAALIEGTRLSWSGRTLISASQAGAFSIEYRDGWAAASVQAPPGTDVRLTPISEQPFKTVLLGSVAGAFEPSTLSEGAYVVPQGEAPLAGYWLVLNKPDWLTLDAPEPASLKETLADGKPVSTGVLPPGTVPERLEMAFTPGANPLDPDTLRVCLNGALVDRGLYEVDTAAEDGFSIIAPLSKFLSPDQLAPRFYTTHRLEVVARDRGLMRRKFSGHFRFSLRPVIKDDVVYLSDLKPIKAFAHGGLILDRSYSVDRITLAATDYPKGLTTHPETVAAGAYAEIIYDMKPYAGKRREFRALVGMQDKRGGSVQFYVYTRAGEGEWQERARTGIMTAGSDPVDIAVPLQGVEQLRLYVTDAGDGINSDHATWAMARLE